jgi:hypothetical protein
VDAEDTVVVASEDVDVDVDPDPDPESKSDADDRAALPVPSMVVVYV